MSETQNQTPDTSDERTVGKTQPTPSRREQEAARKRPLVSDGSKEARKAAREQLIKQRERARLGMAAGEERYLPVRDRGIQKRFVRNYVDSRIGVGEFLIPAMFLVIILTLFPQREMQLIAMGALWLFFLLAIAEAIYLGWKVHKLLAEKHGLERVERGVRWYAAMRGMQLRIMRMPKPQVKRGQRPE